MGLIPEWIVSALMLASTALVTLWMAGAIYYDVCGGARWGRWVAVAWAVGVIAMFVAWQPLWQPFVALLGVAALFLVWWFRQKPSHDRDWDPSVAVLPRAVRAGDAVTIENVRNFEYRSLDDFTPRYETRTYHLVESQGVDIIFFNWGSALMSHPVLVFDFGPDGRVCMSIEVRYREGAEVLDPSQPLPTAGTDLRRRGRARRHPAAHEVQPGPRRRTCTASTRAPRNCGPRSSITSDAINQPVRDAALVPRPVHELHHVVLPAAQQPGPLRLARHRQRPAGSGPLRGRSTGPDSALRGTPPTRLPQRHCEQRPGGRDSGITSAANSKGAAMNDDVIPLLKVHEYFQGVSDETLAGSRAARDGSRSYPAGSVVHEADVVLTTVGFVLRGRLKAVRVEHRGTESLFRMIERGEQFGMMVGALGEPVPIRVVALEPTTVLRLDYEAGDGADVRHGRTCAVCG